jgi:outer membrane lipoprotein-sorting protein
MLSALMFAAAITGTQADPLDSAISHYHAVESYRVTIHAFHADGEEHIRYYYRKPGFVRMEFIRPHDGAVLVYNPLTKRVRLWPFGTGRFPEFNLNPGNPLIRSSHGQHVDRSDVGALFENVRTLRVAGNIEMSGEEDVGGRRMLHLIVTGAGDFAVAGVHRYELWLDTESQFPVRIISRDQQDAVIETVVMDDLEINATLPEALFNPQER